MWLKLKVLSWKSLKLQKKYWFCTVIEIIVSCLLFFYMKHMRSYNTGRGLSNNITIPNPVSEQILYNEFMEKSSSEYFIYTPKTAETEQIMKHVAKNFKIPYDNIDTANSEIEMNQKMIDKINSPEGRLLIGYGIVFEEIIKSNVFKYKIKSTHDMCDTDLLFPEYEEPGPMDSGKDYFRLGFLALQLMLDKTFINLDMFDRNTINITGYNLEIQSYPYAKFIQDPQFQKQFQLLFPMFTVLSFLLMCLQTIKRIVEEKASGIRELMKIMGLKSWMIWTGWLLHNLYIYALSITVITYISCFEVYNGTGKLLNYTDPLLFWIFLLMFMISGVFFCFAISSAFNRPLLALMVGIILWIFSFVLPYNLLKPTTSKLIKIILMLLPNVAVTTGFTSISSLESSGVGLQFSTLFTPGKGNNNFSVGFVLFMFILNCFLYGFIAWYLNSVMPGDYGIAKPLNFLFKCSKYKSEKSDMLPVSIGNRKLFEKPPSDFEVGVSIKNLHKQFGNFNALNGVNLDLYKGQITALLGHNGAGKTTTMSIITGLFSPSSGIIEINGNNLFSNMDKFRKSLGLCPQHNLLFSYLTTLDHLIFFGMLKGKSLEQSKSDGLRLLELFSLQKKKDEYISNLSGGMKRKVSLAIALVGNPEILILDEPTSGMDPESRRQMWDLILSFRGTRTILITTHFMEEADVLGDRIAIMDHGQIKCYGTSLFLKKVYGTGYKLTVIKEEMCNETKIVEEIRTIVPEATIQSSLSAKFVINLHNKNTDQFSNLFKMLENNRTEFGINGMTISSTTMEDVFLSSAVTKNYGDEPHQHNNNFTETLVPMYVSGNNLFKNQLKVLLEKKVTYTYRRWFMSLVYGLGSIILSILVMTSTYASFGNSGVSQALNLSLSTYKDISVYYRAGDVSSGNLEPLFVDISKKNQATVIEASQKNDIINDLLEMCNQDVLMYRYSLMIAGDFNQNNSTIMYNNVAIHTPAIAINLYTNALLQQVSGKHSSYISTVNERILEKTVNACSINFVINLTFLWLTIFTPGLLFLIGYFIALPLSERVSGIKHLQMMTKLSPITYWIACFLWDYFCYIIIVVLSLIAMYMIDTYHVFTGPNEIMSLLVLMLIYGWSSIFYAYVYSFYNKTLVSSMLLFMSINFVSGLFINNIMFFMKYSIKKRNKITPFNFWNIFRYITLIIPHFSFSSCLLGFIEISWGNNRCNVCNTFQECRDSTDYKQRSYFVFASDENEFGILEETLFLVFSSILYIAIVLLFDYKVLSYLYQLSLNTIIGLGDSYKGDSEDSDVGHEKDRVDAAKTKSISYDSPSPIMLVDNLVKKFSFKFTGVRGISFAVSPGECFGLLGVNGAGKTTTFRILTGDMFPSQGDAYVQTGKLYKLSSSINQFASIIGYCPQFDAINDQLTGRETLKLMAILRGISPLKTKYHINKWIKLLDLEECKDKICGNYSGGNKRKLNTAMALIGDPPLVFLDEPTSGVDPVARRNLWRLLAISQRRGQAVVLTSHSMDECEALCNRLTIMVDGVMKCIGDIQYLKNRYGQGFTIILKLINKENTIVDELKSYTERQFSPSIFLKDEHKGMLHYHITNPHLPLSDIFGFMKAIKDKYPIIEDYTVGDTTLEEVFIAFAKKQAVLKTNL